MLFHARLYDGARDRCWLTIAAPRSLVSIAGDCHPIMLSSTVERMPGVWDAERLERVLQNLLSNAVKYSPPDAPIELTIRAADHEAQVMVLDRGMGLEGTDVDQLFSAFYRSERARSRASGLGVGLAASRRVEIGRAHV